MLIIPAPVLEEKDQTLEIIFAYIGFKASLRDIRPWSQNQTPSPQKKCPARPSNSPLETLDAASREMERVVGHAEAVMPAGREVHCTPRDGWSGRPLGGCVLAS